MKIARYPSRFIIEGINDDIKTKLERSLSVWDKGRFEYTSKIYKYENDRMYIPGSMSLYKLRSIGIDTDIIEDKRDCKIKTRTMTKVLLTKEPRDELQKAAIYFLKGNNYSKGSTQNYLSLKTGKGKTYCAINYCVSTKKIPLIFVDQDTLMQQWKNAILQFTNIKEDNIYCISGQKTINDLMNMTKKQISKYKFFIVIHRTMKKYLDNNSIEAGNKFAEKLGIGVKIFDEAHLEILSMFQIDESMDTESVYLSATPERSDMNENYMYKNAIRECKMFSTEKGIFKEENYHNILLVKVNSKPTIKESIKFKTKYGFSVNEYGAYMEKDKKWEFFVDKIKRLIKFANKGRDKKIAIIMHLVSSVDRLEDELKKEYPDKEIGKLYGSTNKEDKDKVLKESDILITTDMSFSKGVDMKNLEIIINTVPISSKPRLEQVLGRLRYLKDREVWFFDLIDMGIPHIGNMMRNKKEIYTKKGKLVKDVYI